MIRLGQLPFDVMFVLSPSGSLCRSVGTVDSEANGELIRVEWHHRRDRCWHAGHCFSPYYIVDDFVGSPEVPYVS